MHNWFLSKVTYEKTTESGLQKKVTEQYLVDALSFTEAEARTIEEMKPFITGEFTVSAVGRARLSESFLGEGDRYYKAKLNFITLDEKSGQEKKTAVYMLVQADNFEQSLNKLNEGMKGTISDYEIVSITETAILDVFEWNNNID